MAELVWHYWQETCRRFPHKPAVIEAASGQTWSFEEIHQAALQWKPKLRSAGLSPGRILTLARPNSAEWIAVFLAAQSIGALVLPLEPQSGEGIIRSIAQSVGATTLLLGTEEKLFSNAIHPRGTCLVKATSGSTGNPRCFVFTDRQMCADCFQIIEGMGLDSDDSNYAAIPFGHSYGLGNLVFPLILHGMTLVLSKGFFPAEMIEDLLTYQPTVFPSVPPLIRALAEHESVSDLKLRLVISAGGRLSATVRDAFRKKHGVAVRNFYGSSESGGISFNRNDPPQGAPVTVGHPLPGVTIDLESDGTVCVTSAAVYTLGNPTADDHLGKVELADTAYWSAEGELVLTGRHGPEVKLSGRRVCLTELESTIMEVEGVEDCFVHVYEDSSGEPSLGIIVSSLLGQDKVRSCLKESLPKWMRPKKCIILDQLPMTSRGKKCRRSLLRLLGV